MQQSFLYFPSHLSPALDQGGFCGGQVWGTYLPFRPRPVIHVRGTGDPGECLECSSVPLLGVGQAASCPSPSPFLETLYQSESRSTNVHPAKAF